jgi:hypothetical protein
VAFDAHFFDYGERSEREPPAIGKASRDARVRAASLPVRRKTEPNAGRDDGDEVCEDNPLGPPETARIRKEDK